MNCQKYLKANKAQWYVLLLLLLSYYQSDSQVVAGKYFVKVKTGVTYNLTFNSNNLTAAKTNLPADFFAIVQQYNISQSLPAFTKLKEAALEQIYLVSASNITSLTGFEEAVKALSWIEYIEPLPDYGLFSTPNDSLFGQQGYLNQIKAPAAWNISKGDKNVVVAIVDDAVKTAHSDLKNSLWVNKGEIPNNHIDDDGNGYIDDVNGYDVGDSDGDPSPPPGSVTSSFFTHGTHCAGVAAATTNNKTGVASIGYNTRIASVKVLPDAAKPGEGLLNAFLGIEYAIVIQANVISMSWGGLYQSSTYQYLFNVARKRGIILVAAAGNDGSNLTQYPAAYTNVMGVGSVNQNDIKSSFSNYGKYIDIMAPGEQIISTLATGNNVYGLLSGTSTSCPMVAGLCALMLSLDSSLSPAFIENCLKSSADNLDSLNPVYAGQLGTGRINAANALSCVGSPSVVQFVSDRQVICPGRSIVFRDTSLGTSSTSLRWEFQGGIPASSSLPSPVVTYNNAGTFGVKLVISNQFGIDSVSLPGYVTVQQPTATISGSTSIQPGDTVLLNVSLTGVAPFSFAYTDGVSAPKKISNITSNNYYLPVNPLKNTSYSLTTVSDANCTGTVSGQANISMRQPLVISCGAYPIIMQKTTGNKDDVVTHALKLANDRIAVAGNTNSLGSGNTDMYVQLSDSLGNILWSRVIGGSGPDSISYLIQTSDGGMVGAGGSSSFGSGNLGVLFKLDLNGNLLWFKTIGPNFSSLGGGIIELSDKSLIVNGCTNGAGAGDFDIYLIKTDGNGNVLKAITVGTNQYERSGKSLLVNNTILVYAQSSAIKGNPSADPAICYLDTNLNLKKSNLFSSLLNNMAGSVKAVADRQKNLILGGYFTGPGSYGQQDLFLIKTDTNGNVLWSKNYGSTKNEQLYDMAVNADNTVIISGASGSFSKNGDLDGLMLKIDANGNILNSVTFGGSLDDIATSVIPFNNYLAGLGGTKSFSTNGNDEPFMWTFDDCFTPYCRSQTVQLSAQALSFDSYTSVFVSKPTSQSMASNTPTILSPSLIPTTIPCPGNAPIPASITASYIFCGNANDVSGNNLNGTLLSPVATTDRFGIQGRAYNFNGSTDRIEIPDSPKFNFSNSFSVNCWVNFSTINNKTPGYNIQTIFSKPDYQDIGLSFWTDNYLNVPKNTLRITHPGYTPSHTDFLWNTIAPNQWHMVTIVVSPTSSNIYIDGQLKTNQALTGTFGGKTAGKLYLGATYDTTNIWNTSYPYPFNGKLDDVNFYNGVLTNTQITNLYNTQAFRSIYAGPDRVTCQGDTLNLKAKGVTNPVWSPGNTHSYGFNPVPLTDTIYYLFGLDSLNGCADYDTVKVLANPLPALTTVSDTTVCIGKQLTLYASGANSYSWRGSGSLSCLTCTTPVTLVQGVQSYTVTGANTFGCSKSKVIRVNGQKCCKSLKANFTLSKTDVCVGDTLSGNNTSIASNYATFNWTTNQGLPLQILSSGKKMVLQPTTPGIYSVNLAVTDTCGQDSLSQVVYVNNLPDLAPLTDTTICKGNTVLIGNNEALGDINYRWSPGVLLSDSCSGTPITEISDTTTFVRYTTNLSTGCTRMDTTKINVITPRHGLSLGADDTTQLCNPLLIGVNPEKGFHYAWSSGQNTSTILVNNSGNYALRVYGQCTDTTLHKNVTIRWLSLENIANVFTPNSDGKNDLFTPSLCPGEWSFTVFNRWGKQVYKQENFPAEWDGSHLDNGVYFYEIANSAGASQKGWVEILK